MNILPGRFDVFTLYTYFPGGHFYRRHLFSGRF